MNLRKEFIALFFALSIFIAACVAQESVLIPTQAITSTSFPNPKAIESQNTIKPTSIQIITQTISPYGIEMPLVLNKTVEEITIELTSYKQEYNLLTIEFCFTSPSSENWVFDDVFLILDNQEISPKELRYNSGGESIPSCGSLSFPTKRYVKSEKVELIIGQLQTDVMHPDCIKAQKKLDKAQPELIVKVHCFSTEQGEGMRIETIRKPENMSDDDVADYVKDAFADVIELDLTFEFSIDGP